MEKRDLTPRVRMTETEKQKLDELAWYYGIPYSEVIRRLIIREYDEMSTAISNKLYREEDTPEIFKKYLEE